MLSGVSATWLAIDGLDQIPPPMQQAWKQTLHRLLIIPNLTILITAREEVVAAHGWMQELLSTLPEIRVDELSDKQVETAFRQVGLQPPRNRALLDCLKNTFLLSIYAQTVNEHEMPLVERGEVTAFTVIEAYWRRRVTAESQGMRAAGDPSTSAASKREAAAYLADRTLAGDLVIKRPAGGGAVSAGIESLCREGVLLDRSTSTVMWSHSWLREYSAIDCLVGRIPLPNVNTIAADVCAIDVDHAARDAAVGGCKWILAHRNLGQVEDYLSALYRRTRGLAREALAILLEDSPAHLQLANLHPELLNEALCLATAMKASQWSDQVASLPDSLFTGPGGPQLSRAVLRYESEVIRDG
jgi:hypothetical protein